MQTLYIFPTSRSIRERKSVFKDSLIDKAITISDFENRSILIENRSLIDSKKRILFLKEAANFDGFNRLKSDLNLIKFYSQSQDFFRFFEELAVELVDIESLKSADYYAEFDRDLDILKELIINYKKLLDRDNLIDKAFIVKEYKINWSFLNSYDRFILELEGFLTNFELKLFNEIAQKKEFLINIRTTPFNKKMQDAFRGLGIALPSNSIVTFNLSTKEILKSQRVNRDLNCEVVKSKDRLAQIAIAFCKIEEFVKSGIDPQRIAFIVPDESMALVIKDFDKYNNTNLAMGIKYTTFTSFRALKALKEYLDGNDLLKDFLISLNVDIKNLKDIDKEIDTDAFFDRLKEFNLPLYNSDDFEGELEKLDLKRVYFRFKRIFKGEFTFKQWLFLWIEELKNHTLDDVRGGKVTVLGALESRGVKFDGVVIIDFNEDFVPSIPSKDRFLNTQVRANAKLPTKEDRENLQKYYYFRVLERAKKSCIIFHTSNGAMPSKFLYELNLHQNIKQYKEPVDILFNQKSRYLFNSHSNDLVVPFDARAFIWSATSLKIYLECKRRFYYSYIKKLKEPKSDDINEGAILHQVLSRVLKRDAYFNSRDEIFKILQIEIEKEKSQNIELLYKKVVWKSILKDFIDKTYIHLKSGWRIIDSEKEIRGEILGLKFKGFIDRLDKKDNKLLVIDYKTGAVNNPSKADNLSHFQMNIYKLIFNKKDIDFAYIQILNGADLEFVNAIEEKEQKLLETIYDLKNQKELIASRCEELHKCRFCPYQLLCHRGEYL